MDCNLKEQKYPLIIARSLFDNSLPGYTNFLGCCLISVYPITPFIHRTLHGKRLINTCMQGLCKKTTLEKRQTMNKSLLKNVVLSPTFNFFSTIFKFALLKSYVKHINKHHMCNLIQPIVDCNL